MNLGLELLKQIITFSNIGEIEMQGNVILECIQKFHKFNTVTLFSFTSFLSKVINDCCTYFDIVIQKINFDIEIVREIICDRINTHA